MTGLQKQQITEMRSKGFVFAEIAAELNLSINSVKSFCRRNDVVPEKKKEAEIIEPPVTTSASAQHSGCKRCGAELVNTPGHRQKTFCSVSCRQKYWWEHRDLIQHHSFITITCPACGHIFSDYAGHKRKYCSHACYIADRYRKGDADESERNNLSSHNEAIPENA